MENDGGFIDYYRLLQVNPDCDFRTLEAAYRYLAKRYHPDHDDAADIGRFTELTEAYKVLRDPSKRADFDRLYSQQTNRSHNRYPLKNDLEIDGTVAVNDAEIHERILLHLYKRRREQPHDAGVVGWILQELLECSDDNFEFHIWYLKSKGFLELTDQGTLAVTIQGVDHVISTCRTSLPQKLLIAQSSDIERD